MVRSAAEVMQLALPDAVSRLAVLKLLQRSTGLAASISPAAWAVHLFDWGFRLHVGQVEAMTLFDDKLWVMLATSANDRRLAAQPIIATSFKCLRDPHSAFVGSIGQFADSRHMLEPLHMAFVEIAARTVDGKPRKGTPFTRFHSRELMDYTNNETSTDRNRTKATSKNRTVPPTTAIAGGRT